MPKKTGTAKLQEFEIRITPREQNPVSEEEFKKSFEAALEYLICEEGEPNGEPKLHYHGYVKAKISESKMSQICAQLGKANEEIKGNAIFMCKPTVNENLKGYVVKGKKVIATTYDQNTIENYFEISDSYKREKAANKKAASRSSKKSLADIMSGVEVDEHSTPTLVIQQILKEYSKIGKDFPPKSQIESAVLKKLYTIQPGYVVHHYAANLETSMRFYKNPPYQ